MAQLRLGYPEIQRSGAEVLQITHNTPAEAQSYFLRVDAPASGPAVVLASGRYLDRLQRGVDGRWRIRTLSSGSSAGRWRT